MGPTASSSGRRGREVIKALMKEMLIFMLSFHRVIKATKESLEILVHLVQVGNQDPRDLLDVM